MYDGVGSNAARPDPGGRRADVGDPPLDPRRVDVGRPDEARLEELEGDRVGQAARLRLPGHRVDRQLERLLAPARGPAPDRGRRSSCSR